MKRSNIYARQRTLIAGKFYRIWLINHWVTDFWSFIILKIYQELNQSYISFSTAKKNSFKIILQLKMYALHILEKSAESAIWPPKLEII